MFKGIRDAIDGKKAYLVMVGAIIAAVIGWSNGSLTDVQALSAIFAALQTGAFRSAFEKIGIG